MPSKKNTEAPAAKIARNPSDKTARAMYDAVVAQEGTVGGVPARIALYGTKYAALEVGGDGAWEVDHDTAFGGVRAIETLHSSFDEVLVLGGDMREIQLTAGNVAVVEPEIVEAVDAEPVVVELDPVDFAKAEANIAAAFPAPVVAAEPVLATLDEVRAAHEAETRGACRASVLRALRVRAGEIALGVVAGGKAEKVKAERPAPREVVVDPTKAKASDIEALRTLLGPCLGQIKIEIAASAFTAEAGFPATASEKGNHWRYDRPGVKAAAALGYSVEWNGRNKTVEFTGIESSATA